MRKDFVNLPDEGVNLPSESDKVLVIDSRSEIRDFKAALTRLVQYADLANIIPSIEKAGQYIVDVPLEFQEALNKGLVEINQNAKNGRMWPTLVRKLKSGKKEFVANLPIHQESVLNRNPMRDISSGMQMMQIQNQIAELKQLLIDTYEAVLRVEEGQKDDRVGKLKSGYEGIQHALLHEGDQRLEELIEARGQVREAKNQIFEVLKSRIEAFKRVEGNQFLRFGILMFDTQYDAKKDAEYHRIQDYFDLYLKAVQLHAVSFAAVGDIILAEKIYNDAYVNIASLDFSALATIRNIHSNVPESDFFYATAAQIIENEKNICLEEAKPYDYIELSFTGEELMEVIENDKETVSEEAARS